jgi:hypothetical protein
MLNTSIYIIKDQENSKSIYEGIDNLLLKFPVLLYDHACGVLRSQHNPHQRELDIKNNFPSSFLWIKINPNFLMQLSDWSPFKSGLIFTH